MDTSKRRKSRRYDTSGIIEAQFEPGSHDRVLRNLLAIKTVDKMDQAEALALEESQDLLIRTYDRKYQFTAKDICQMHKVWMGKIYAWAGEYRRVNLSKDNSKFATAEHIPNLMQDFETTFLNKNTPCLFKKDAIAQALAEVHVELVLIHPFREGNGRVSRLLAILMALQAGLPILDFSDIQGKRRESYFLAVQEGMKRNYKPMEEVFKKVIETSVSRVKER
ncbi:MAG: Fic family protein [Candidatus Omnitrophica bacterium]|nr:Fic family protein [Candidatus Omnitrophota bacterium]